MIFCIVFAISKPLTLIAFMIATWCRLVGANSIRIYNKLSRDFDIPSFSNLFPNIEVR